MWKVPVRIYPCLKTSVVNGKSIVIPLRNASGQPGRKSGTNLITVTAAGTIALIGGGVLMAKTNDPFRKITEAYIPGAPYLFTLILGPHQQPNGDSKPQPFPEEGLLKRKLEREAVKVKEEPLVIPTEENMLPNVPLVSTELPLPTHLEPIEMANNPVVAESTDPAIQTENTVYPESVVESFTSVQDQQEAAETVLINLAGIDDTEYSQLIKDLHAKAAGAVNQAVTAQDAAAAAIKKHVEMVFKSLETIYEPGLTPENVWEPVFLATQEKTEAVQSAAAKAKEARVAVAQLKEAVAYGLKHDQSSHTPDLITLDETVARALYSLETAKARVEAAESEAKVMDEYRELVDTARRNLQLELSSIRPEMATTFKKEDTRLGEEELNILMAHAYWKIIALQRELAKQQLLEQQRLRAALDSQRKESNSLLESRLRVELERQYYELKAKYNQEFAMNEKVLSDQFTQQLKRQAAAYTDHLNDCLDMKEQEMQRKFEGEQALEQAKFLLTYHEELAKLQGMAKGIRDVVHERAEKDNISRQVRELWIAAQLLIDSLRSNEMAHLPWEEQRCHLGDQLKFLSLVINRNEFTRTIIESLPPSVVCGGVLPLGAIKERFLNVERVCRRVALVDKNDSSLLRYALSYLQSIMLIKLDERAPPSKDDEIDPAALNTFDVLARTRYHLEKDDPEQALRYMNLLKGEPRNVASGWLQDLRLHLEAVQAAQAILTYAAVQSIECV